jgi:hypothetical protein
VSDGIDLANNSLMRKQEVVMNKRSTILTLFAISALTLVSTGCGKKITGNYSLVETQAGAVQNASSCMTLPTTLNLTENGTAMSGSSASSCYSQTMTGTDAGNQITGVSLTLTPLTQAQPQYNLGTTTSAQPCVYTGTLNVNSNQISGTLTLVAQAVQQQQPQQTMISYCATSLTINGNLLN